MELLVRVQCLLVSMQQILPALVSELIDLKMVGEIRLMNRRELVGLILMEAEKRNSDNLLTHERLAPYWPKNDS
jgi:hypothetical protein